MDLPKNPIGVLVIALSIKCGNQTDVHSDALDPHLITAGLLFYMPVEAGRCRPVVRKRWDATVEYIDSIERGGRWLSMCDFERLKLSNKSGSVCRFDLAYGPRRLLFPLSVQKSLYYNWICCPGPNSDSCHGRLGSLIG
jgi:hypothetical protein